MANTYSTSSGERITQATLDRKIRATKAMISQSRLPICEGSGSSDDILDMDHTLSVDMCKKIGKAELAYDPENIVISTRLVHNIWENGTIEDRMKLLNFYDRMQYLKKHCAERFISLLIGVGSFDKLRYYQLLHPFKDIEEYLSK